MFNYIEAKFRKFYFIKKNFNKLNNKWNKFLINS